MSYTLTYQQLAEMEPCLAQLQCYERMFGREPVEWNIENIRIANEASLHLFWLYDGVEYANLTFFLRDTIIALGFNTDTIDMHYAFRLEEYQNWYREKGFDVNEYCRRVYQYLADNPPEVVKYIREESHG